MELSVFTAMPNIKASIDLKRVETLLFTHPPFTVVYLITGI